MRMRNVSQRTLGTAGVRLQPGESADVPIDRGQADRHPFVMEGWLVPEGMASAPGGAPESEPESEPESGPEGESTDDGSNYEALKQQAEDLGIKVDGRWSEDRIRRKVDQALQE